MSSPQFTFNNLNIDNDVDHRRFQISQAVENGAIRTCPFCLSIVTPTKILGHVRLCMYLWEEETECEHVFHVKHVEGLMEREQKKRKLAECSPPRLSPPSSSQSQTSSSESSSQSQTSSSEGSSSQTNAPFLDRESYYEEPQYKKDRVVKKGLCCLDGKSCNVDKRKTSPQLVVLHIMDTSFNFCKLSHLSSSKIRQEFIQKEAAIIKKSAIMEEKSNKNETCCFCNKECSGKINVKSRDSVEGISFCSAGCLFKYMNELKTSSWASWVKKNGKKPKKNKSIEDELTQVLGDGSDTEIDSDHSDKE